MISGRTSELKYLSAYYEREGSQIMVVYGEKNVGKTVLLRQFMEDKLCYYYRARAASEREQRYLWGRELAADEKARKIYPSFLEIFQTIGGGKDSKKVIVIDEFQHIIKSDGSFMKELVSFVRSQQSRQVMVILCSSSISWVENSMITRIGEAAYELSGFLKIKELPFENLMEAFPEFSMEQCVEAYAILGGVPGLWKYFDDQLSIRQNICKNILDPGAFLYGEGQRIVEEELREMSVYNTILASIAAGAHKLNDLYLHTEFSRAKISVYLKNLMELELVEKVFSYDTGEKTNAQKGIYRISNHFVHFYFTYLYPNLSDLELLGAEKFYEKYIAPTFKSYVGDYFKTVCKQYMENGKLLGEFSLEIDRIGEWVGKQGTIDMIAQNDKGEIIVGGCCWDKLLMSYGDYKQLLDCLKQAKLQADYIYLFSAGSFDQKLSLEAKVKQNLKLISMDEM